MAFRDVPRDAWFAPYVRVAAEQGIVGGYQDAQGNLLGEYKPENPVSLEEVAKIAVVAAYVDVLSCPASKNVTASGSWSMGYVGCAESRGWGVFSDATADVKRPATRAEVVFTVLQALGAQGASTTGSGWTTGFHDVPKEFVSKYGIVDIAEKNDDRLKKIVGLVEKPSPDKAPSTLGIVGKYIIPHTVLDALQRIEEGSHGGEVRLIDALIRLKDTIDIFGYVFEGTRLDTGTPEGYKEAVQRLG
jgi:hypothetical protein